MAFADWDTNTITSAGTVGAVHDLGSNVVGTGALEYQSTANFQDFAVGTQPNNTHAWRGMTSGRIRSLVQVGQWTQQPQFYGSWGFGFYYMANNLDIANNGADYYFAGLVRVRLSATTLTPTIGRPVGGNKPLHNLVWHTQSPTDAIVQDAGENITVALDDIIPMEIEWYLDQAVLGGMRHTFRLGNINDTDFSNLAVVYDFIDTSPITSSTIEGMFIQKSDTQFVPSTYDLRWDQTEFAEIV